MRKTDGLDILHILLDHAYLNIAITKMKTFTVALKTAMYDWLSKLQLFKG
jgi:hypothetical protein